MWRSVLRFAAGKPTPSVERTNHQIKSDDANTRDVILNEKVKTHIEQTAKNIINYRKIAHGTVSYNKSSAKYKAVIPQSWTPTNIQRCIGMYDTQENAQNALTLYYDAYVKDRDTPLSGTV